MVVIPRKYHEGHVSHEERTRQWQVCDVKKNDLKGLTYDQILTYLKSAKKEDRLKKYKALLKFKNIPYEADLFTWHNEDL